MDCPLLIPHLQCCRRHCPHQPQDQETCEGQEGSVGKVKWARCYMNVQVSRHTWLIMLL